MKLRSLISLAGLGATALVGGCACAGGSDNPEADRTVALMDGVFVPALVTIQAGDTVRWVHNDGDEEHSVTSGEPDTAEAGVVFDEDMGEDGAQLLVTFTQPGAFPYFCRYHFMDGMTGTVLVEVPGQGQ